MEEISVAIFGATGALVAVVAGAFFWWWELRRPLGRLINETRSVVKDIEAQLPRASEGEAAKRERFMARRSRILYYLNGDALADLATGARPRTVAEQVTTSRTGRRRGGISVRLPFVQSVGAEAATEDEASTKRVVEQERTEALEYDELERTLVDTGETRLCVEDFEPEDVLQSIDEVETELKKLKQRGVPFPDDIADTYKWERLAEVAGARLDVLRHTPFLLLMEGKFSVDHPPEGLSLTYRHPLSDFLSCQVEFRFGCEADYIRQPAAFSTNEVNATVLGRATGAEETDAEFILHVLPVAIY